MKSFMLKVLFLGKVSLAEISLPGNCLLGKEISDWERFWGNFLTKRADDKIRKLFPESDKKENFSRMEYPRILRNIHPC